MNKDRIQRIKKTFVSINQYRRRHGLITAFRAFIHYSYRVIKNYQTNLDGSIITVNGYKMLTIPNDPGISTELSIFKSHEPLNTKILSKMLKKGMTCLDIGGNIGYYVLLERQLIGSEGKIIAIEPLQRNFDYLKKNIELQNVTNISTYRFACGDKNGKVPFIIDRESNGSWIIPDGMKNPDPSRGTITEVPLRILDEFVEELGLERVDFVRMDVEGYEIHILKGLKKTLEKFKPIISFELHKNFLGVKGTHEIFKLLKGLNYKVESFVTRDLDIPLIGTMKDIKQPTIDEALDIIENGKVGSFFMLNFVNRTN